MLSKVKQYIIENNLINNGDKVLIALSGGPDSIVLLHALNSLKDELNIKLFACHINHKLRGKDSDGDEKFVIDLCKGLNIPLYSKSFDVNKYSRDNNIGIEEGAREIRYSYFKEIKDLENIDKIAIAHNMNDQCETLIHRFIRGTGITGLKGISPKRDEIFIRPILCIKREEIENYIRENNLTFRIDKSNEEKDYTRNKIRLDLIPYIKENFNENIVTTLYNMSLNMKEDDDFIESHAKIIFNKFTKEIYKDKVLNEVIIDKALFNEHISIIKRVLFLSIEKLKGSRKNISSVYIKDIVALQRKETGKMINIGEDIDIHNIYGDLKLIKSLKYTNNIKEIKNMDGQITIKDKSMSKEESIEKDIEEIKNEYEDISYMEEVEEINIRVLKEPQCIIFKDYIITLFESDMENPIKGFLKLSLDDFDGNIKIRARKTGDRIKPLGMNNHKRIKSIFIDNKVPRDLRDVLPLIENDRGEIIYLHENIISEDYKLKKNTKRVIFLNIIKK